MIKISHKSFQTQRLEKIIANSRQSTMFALLKVNANDSIVAHWFMSFWRIYFQPFFKSKINQLIEEIQNESMSLHVALPLHYSMICKSIFIVSFSLFLFRSTCGYNSSREQIENSVSDAIVKSEY